MGGDDEQASAELYDRTTETWTFTGNLNVGRAGHSATLLPDGRVLVAGSIDSNFNEVASAELYDPTTGTWSLTGRLHTARDLHMATLLRDGKVLIAGGTTGGESRLASAELYDPATFPCALLVIRLALPAR